MQLYLEHANEFLWLFHRQVNFGGVQNALLEQTTDPILIKLREGVQWRTSLDDILEDVVEGTLATWVSGRLYQIETE